MVRITIDCEDFCVATSFENILHKLNVDEIMLSPVYNQKKTVKSKDGIYKVKFEYINPKN